jgi:hypothetical protein
MEMFNIRKQCLSAKEISAEDYLYEELNACVKEVLSKNLGAGADENLQRAVEMALDKVQSISVTLGQKVQPLVRNYLAYQQNLMLESRFAKVKFPQLPLAKKVAMYRRMFFRLFEDDQCVSFETNNGDWTGVPGAEEKIAPRDLFYLTMWTLATCRREQGDHLLQLAVTGISSAGKSTLVENVMLDGAHNMATEEGVGRFNTGRKNLILLHDVDLHYLYSGADADKIRAISRAETTSAKVHSSVIQVPPMFVLVTSNERIQDHKVREKALLGNHTISVVLPSQMILRNPNGKKQEECLQAIKNRFLECHIRARPRQDPGDLKMMGTFQGVHFVMALFPKIVQLLEKYSADIFFSPSLLYYCIGGLYLNVDQFSQLDCEMAEEEQQHKEKGEGEGDKGEKKPECGTFWKDRLDRLSAALFGAEGEGAGRGGGGGGGSIRLGEPTPQSASLATGTL